MSMRPGAILLVAAAAIAIVACTRAPYLIIFNRTDVSLTIARTPPYESDVTIAVGTARRARFPDTMRLTVMAGSTTWRYAIRFPPPTLARWSMLGTPEFQLLVEPVGRVYVLPPTTKLPAAELPPQPPGFPLAPTA
jgi:hypothetical protein